eukprot:660592_1
MQIFNSWQSIGEQKMGQVMKMRRKKEDLNTSSWKSFPLQCVNVLSENRFSAELEVYFVFDTTYDIRITTKIKNVLLFIIQSNIKTIAMEQQPIPLTIHSATPNFSDDTSSQNLLIEDRSFYIANSNPAFVIFDTKEINVHYIPTKVSLRGCGVGHVKDFNVWIGNAQQDKWLKCNETQLTMQENEEYQTFALDCIHSQNTDTLKEIKYTQYKLEMLNNYGGGSIFLSRFKLLHIN